MQKELEDFELQLRSYTEANFTIGVANATDGLEIAWLALGLQPGDEVICCSHTMLATAAAIKLSELTIGIGPFVIAPAVERKMGLAALSELSIGAHEWKNAYWAQEKGLFAKVFESTSELDKEVEILSEKLASYNPEAAHEMKSILWENTSHWDKLLIDRAAVSGELVLSAFTKNALSKFRK